tara:strand:+ start:207 stop:551 length:345 start_codon:yes stop_codon:yes gene_type:complete
MAKTLGARKLRKTRDKAKSLTDTLPRDKQRRISKGLLTNGEYLERNVGTDGRRWTVVNGKIKVQVTVWPRLSPQQTLVREWPSKDQAFAEVENWTKAPYKRAEELERLHNAPKR